MAVADLLTSNTTRLLGLLTLNNLLNLLKFLAFLGMNYTIPFVELRAESLEHVLAGRHLASLLHFLEFLGSDRGAWLFLPHVSKC